MLVAGISAKSDQNEQRTQDLLAKMGQDTKSIETVSNLIAIDSKYER